MKLALLSLFFSSALALEDSSMEMAIATTVTGLKPSFSWPSNPATKKQEYSLIDSFNFEAGDENEVS